MQSCALRDHRGGPDQDRKNQDGPPHGVKPQLVLIAGPNGAGKSTFYGEFLRKLRLPFLNADILEARSGIPSVEAARILDAIRNELIEQGVGFITETVFSDPLGAKLGLLRKAVNAGYD